MRFFFYGTLVAGHDNPVARTVHARLGEGVRATVPGRLHSVETPDGWYPLLTQDFAPDTDADSDAVVHGYLYEAGPDFSLADLALLDRWENFDPRDPDVGEYRRDAAVARTADGANVPTDVYVYIQPMPAGAIPLARGDFAAWLAETGRRAISAQV